MQNVCYRELCCCLTTVTPDLGYFCRLCMKFAGFLFYSPAYRQYGMHHVIGLTTSSTRAAVSRPVAKSVTAQRFSLSAHGDHDISSLRRRPLGYSADRCSPSTWRILTSSGDVVGGRRTNDYVSDVLHGSVYKHRQRNPTHTPNRRTYHKLLVL